MKRIIALAVLISSLQYSSAQNLIQATIKPGAAAHTIEVYFKPNFTDNTKYFTGIILTLAIPTASITPTAPTATITTGPGLNSLHWVVTPNYTEADPAYAGYTFYSFSTDAIQSFSTVNLTNNTEILAATITLTSTASNTAQVSLVSLNRIVQQYLITGLGATNGLEETYIEMSGLGRVSPNPVTENALYFYTNTGVSTAGSFDAQSPFVTTNSLINLPLKLSSFTGNEFNCSANLQWLTNDEINFNHFEVEQSTDNINFKKVGTVAASGRFTGNTYNFSTSQPDGAVYYRLKMVSNDNSYEYSGTVVVKTNCSGKSYFTMYPNPVSSSTAQLTLNFSAAYKGKGLVTVYNNLGQPVINSSVVVNKGDNVIRINTASLPAGTYTVKTIAENGEAIAPVQKLIKQN